jgi:hypothetical protein
MTEHDRWAHGITAVEALYGGFRQEPLTDESLELAFMARTPA